MNEVNQRAACLQDSIMTEGSGSKKVSKKIGFIGAGQMAEALARGFHSRGVAPASNMYAYDPAPVRRDVFKSFGANPAETSSEVGYVCSMLPWGLAKHPRQKGCVLAAKLTCRGRSALAGLCC